MELVLFTKSIVQLDVGHTVAFPVDSESTDSRLSSQIFRVTEIGPMSMSMKIKKNSSLFFKNSECID